MRTLRLRQTVLSSTTTAIVRLNYTINNYGQSANLDTQIWLTATLTNLETCRTSCIELDVRDYRPLLSINVFNLINTGEVTLKKTTYHINRRKKLEATHVGSTSLLANLLVARDGSGDFKKIKKAVNVGNFLLAISLQSIQSAQLFFPVVSNVDIIETCWPVAAANELNKRQLKSQFLCNGFKISSPIEHPRT
ncbi:hypothetical protein Peur_040315 [Populus x canadensis]